MAHLHMPADFDPAAGQAGIAYHPTRIKRVSTYEFLAGEQVVLLRSPDGIT